MNAIFELFFENHYIYFFRSGPRENSRSRTRANRTRQNSTTSIDSRDSFKHPQDMYYNPRRSSRDQREPSYDRYHNRYFGLFHFKLKNIIIL